MQQSQQTQHFQLDTPQTLALALVAGTMVQVTRGSIWLTLEGHSRDVWLKTHDCWTVPLDAKAWIGADWAAALTVHQPSVQGQTAKPARHRPLPLAVAA